jgi:aspartate--ammonia ligase
MSTLVLDKKADLAGPGIGDYTELEKILPRDYHSLLTRKETQQAIFHLKRCIEDNLCKELHLTMVEVPLIVDVESGVNDMLDRDGSRRPQSSSTFRMTETNIRWMRRWCRLRRSGNAPP